MASWSIGLPKRAVIFASFIQYSLLEEKISASVTEILFVNAVFQPIDKELLTLLTPVAFCHALGHVMSNASFVAVAVSLTYTIKGKTSHTMFLSSKLLLNHGNLRI